MIENLTKAKLMRGEPAFGIGLGLGSPIAAELLTHSGADFIQIDGQHGSFHPAVQNSTTMAFSILRRSSANREIHYVTSAHL